jgi:hypothetical protein
LFERPQTLQRAHDLLRLVLAYVLQDLSLRELSFWAACVLEIDLTDEALRVWLHRSLDWIERLLDEALAPLRVPLATRSHVCVGLLDATMISLPGSTGTDFQLHVTLDGLSGRLLGVQCTSDKEPESLHRCQVPRFSIPIGDRAYGLAKHYAHACERDWYPLLRAPLHALPVFDAHSQQIARGDLLDRAQQGQVDQDVWIHHQGRRHAARLVWAALPPAAAERARRRLRKQAKKKGHTPTAQGLALAGWVVLLTRLPREHFSVEWLLRMYRQRWQIELFFKRCRQLLGLGPTKKMSPRLTRVVLLAKMLVVALVQRQFPDEVLQPTTGHDRSLWRLTRVLLISLTVRVFATLTEGWQRWQEKLVERSRRRKRAAQAWKHLCHPLREWQAACA